MTNFTDRFGRISIGFEDIINDFERLSSFSSNTYPPHNVIKVSENEFRLEFAVAGYKEGDIEITQDDGYLLINGEQPNDNEEVIDYVHKGISGRSFRNKFRLAEYVEVSSAELEHGLLSIMLTRVIPDSKKPKLITIGKSA